MNKTSLLVLSIAAFSLNAGSLEIGQESVCVPSRLAGASVSLDDGSFYVTQGAQAAKVEAYNLDESLRGISGTNLTTFLNHGYLTLNQKSDSEYTLKSNIRVLGGINWFKEKIQQIDDAAKGIAKGVVDVTHGTADAAIGVVTIDPIRIESSAARAVKGVPYIVLGHERGKEVEKRLR